MTMIMIVIVIVIVIVITIMIVDMIVIIIVTMFKQAQGEMLSSSLLAAFIATIAIVIISDMN